MPDSHEVTADLSTLPPVCSPSPTGSSSILSDLLHSIKGRDVDTTVSDFRRASNHTIADLLQSDTGNLDPKASLLQDAMAWMIGDHSVTSPCITEDTVVMTAASKEELVHHSGDRSASQALLKTTPNVWGQ
jgi:hypothetical protein